MATAAGATTAVEWAAAGAAFPGEEHSGDLHAVLPVPGGTLLAAVDGLGHGDEAFAAARLAVDAVGRDPAAPLDVLMRSAHEALRHSRGAAMTLALVHQDGRMEWLGVGNVDGVVVRAPPGDGLEGGREGIVLRGGIVGHASLPALRTTAVELRRGDVVVLATDGVRSDFAATVDAALCPDVIAATVLEEHGRGYDDALVVVARFLGGAP